MNKLPRVIVTTIIRTADINQTHGYIYVVDLEKESINRCIKWDNPDISYEGRGGERGLRGIEFYNDNIYIGSGTKLLEFDNNLEIKNSYYNKYLSDVHEISRNNLIYKICNKFFLPPLFTFKSFSNYDFMVFDPSTDTGPTSIHGRIDTQLHLNTVAPLDGKILFSGTNSNYQFSIENDNLKKYAVIPLGTHNVLPYRGLIIYNHTTAKKVIISNLHGIVKRSFKTVQFKPSELEHMSNNAKEASPGWLRGLCIFKDKILISGTSPATIKVYDIVKKK